MNDISKVLIIIIVLLLCIIGSGIYTNKVLTNDSKELEKHISIMQNHIKNEIWQDAENELIYIKEYWSKKQSNWAILQSHFEIDNIDSALTKLTEYITTEALSLALAESSLLMQYIKHIPKNVSFSLENIL